MSERAEHLTKLANLIDDIEIAMLTTIDEAGELRSRPMATQKMGESAELWFFTNKDAPKVAEAQAHPVALAYAAPSKNRYVSVSGSATIVIDAARARELWKPEYKLWFPGGVDDPQIGLLRVDIESAEYWDMPSSTFVYIAGFAKAALDGKTYHPAQHEKLVL